MQYTPAASAPSNFLRSTEKFALSVCVVVATLVPHVVAASAFSPVAAYTAKLLSKTLNASTVNGPDSWLVVMGMLMEPLLDIHPPPALTISEGFFFGTVVVRVMGSLMVCV